MHTQTVHAIQTQMLLASSLLHVLIVARHLHIVVAVKGAVQRDSRSHNPLTHNHHMHPPASHGVPVSQSSLLASAETSLTKELSAFLKLSATK